MVGDDVALAQATISTASGKMEWIRAMLFGFAKFVNVEGVGGCFCRITRNVALWPYVKPAHRLSYLWKDVRQGV
jgi:hypothetical protein